MNEVLIKGGRIVTGVDDYGADILIRNGKIETIGRALGVELRLLCYLMGV
jgi:dihydroorotase-like cyclic amidohydrolase